MSISSIDEKILWARAGGICSNPNCRMDLTVLLEKNNYHIGEMAHIIAKKEKGNRGVIGGGSDSYNNLILLCPTCHKQIDKSPNNHYSVTELHKWKKEAEYLIRYNLKKSNNSYRLFEFSINIFCFFDYICEFIHSEWLYSTVAKDSVFNILKRAQRNLDFLFGYNEEQLYLIARLEESYYDQRVLWSEMYTDLQKIIVNIENDFHNKTDKKVINIARYYSRLVTNAALDRLNSIDSINLKSALYDLFEYNDVVIDDILNNIDIDNLENSLYNRIRYMLHKTIN